MKQEDLKTLRDFLESIEDFDLIALHSNLKTFETEEEVQNLLVDWFGTEALELPLVRPEKLLNLIQNIFFSRNIN